MIDRIARRLIGALEKSPAQSWEVYLTENHELSITVKGGGIDTITTSAVVGAGIRVLAADRPGFFHTTRFTDDSIALACESVIAVAGVADPDPQVEFISADEASAGSTLALVDPRLGSISLEEKVAMAAEAEGAALSAHPAVSSVDALTYEETVLKERLINSRGVDLSQEASLLSFDASVIAASDDDEQLGWEIACAHHFDELDFGGVAAEAALLAGCSLGARPVPSGRYDVVLAPAVVADLLQILAKILCADAVLRERSLVGLKDLGERWISDALTLIDDGRYALGLGAGAFDSEGTPQQRTTLVEAGVLKDLLYDRYHAVETDRCSTGNGQRASHRDLPTPGASNLFFEPGDGSPAALLKAMKSGLLLTELMNADSADATNGSFSLGASGFRIRESAIAEPVSGIILTGELRDLFTAVQRVGNDLKFYGGYGGASLLVADLVVAGER